MQMTNSETPNTSACEPRSWAKRGSSRIAAIAATAAIVSTANSRGRYQRSLSKQSTKVMRYSTSGSSHIIGIEGTFCVRWLVTATSSKLASAASAIQAALSRAGGAPPVPPRRGAGSGRARASRTTSSSPSSSA